MTSYKIEWKSSARKELRKLPSPIIKRVVAAVTALASDPRPSGSRKLVGSHHTYRIRTGDYRVIYTVLDNKLVIEIVRVAHRKDIYR